MPVLVTGANGFVPVNVVAHLVAAGRDVVALHRSPLDPALERWLRSVGPGILTFVQGDTQDERAVAGLFATHRPDGVVQMAAMTPMDGATERRQVRQIVGANINGALNVLLESAEQQVRRVVFLSSSAVYASSEGGPLDEGAPVREDGALYPLTKLAGEQICRWARANYDLDVRAVRLGPVYGPWERPTVSRQKMSSVWEAVHEALAGRPLRCNNAGLARDWIHASDVAAGLVALLDAPALHHDRYNLAGPSVTMERTLAAVAAAVPGTTIEWVARPDEANVPIPDAPSRAPLDSSRLTTDTGWSPRYDIEEGVAQYVRVTSDQ